MHLVLRPRMLVAAFASLVGLVLVPAALANHPVYVEGNCFGPGALQRVIVVPGTCGDYDGDGRIGTAEDVDEADRVFGTINAALGPGVGPAAGTGANQNGSVIIVASGAFAEVVTITSANGNTTLQAAPGVEATIDAIVQGVAGGAGRQLAPGIIVDAPANRNVTIRNVMSRNWAEGYRILGNSHVTLENARAEGNSNWGIRVQGDARVAITGSSVYGTGFRVGAGTDFPGTSMPAPGVGIEFEGQSAGTICFSTVTRSFEAGIANSGSGDVIASHDTVFDNNQNLKHVDVEDDCIAKDRKQDDDDGFAVPPFGDLGGPSVFVLFVFGLAGAALLLARSRRVTRTI